MLKKAILKWYLNKLPKIICWFLDHKYSRDYQGAYGVGIDIQGRVCTRCGNDQKKSTQINILKQDQDPIVTEFTDMDE